MAEISASDRDRIARLMNDPRYWDARHPENADAVAKVTLAFQQAHKRAAESAASALGTVHVRPYTRVQDGKPVEVSAYDRKQEVAFRSGSQVLAGTREFVQEIAEGPDHKRLRLETLQRMRARGDIAETEISITSIGPVPVNIRLDNLGRTPTGFFYALEFKTNAYDKFSDGQQLVYPLMDLGNHVFSSSPRIRSFGFLPGQPLPPICVYGAYIVDGKLKQWGPISLDPSCR